MATPDQLPLLFPVTCHTDHVDSGSTFVVINGFHENGMCYLPQAITRGASCIVVQDNAIIPAASVSLIKKTGVTVKRVADTRLVLAQLSAQAAGYPAKKLYKNININSKRPLVKKSQAARTI